MKVLTIKQPFATLIAMGIKEYEFRTWKTNYRGELLIHAGKGIDKKAMKKYEHLNLEYPSGAIIAKVNITDCLYIDNDVRAMLKQLNPVVYERIIKDKSWEGYGFRLENIKKIKPVKVNGKLGLWNYE